MTCVIFVDCVIFDWLCYVWLTVMFDWLLCLIDCVMFVDCVMFDWLCYVYWLCYVWLTVLCLIDCVMFDWLCYVWLTVLCSDACLLNKVRSRCCLLDKMIRFRSALFFTGNKCDNYPIKMVFERLKIIGYNNIDIMSFLLNVLHNDKVINMVGSPCSRWLNMVRFCFNKYAICLK